MPKIINAATQNAGPENAEPENTEQDAAWVTIETSFDGEYLKKFLEDIERLYRINALTEFKEMRRTGNGEYHMKIKNLSNDRDLETDLKVTTNDDGIKVSYSNGLKTATIFRIEPNADGQGNGQGNGTASLIVTDEYGGVSAEERKKRVDEVDKSLAQWGRDIHAYLQNWKRWSWVPGWRWYIRRVWQSMKPTARRICYMLFIITFAEFLMFLFVFLIFWLELDKYVG